MSHAFGGAVSKGHHYCVETGDEYSRCCHCGDERPYRMVLARWCPTAMESSDSEVCRHGNKPGECGRGDCA